jgi:hypothetical protein
LRHLPVAMGDDSAHFNRHRISYLVSGSKKGAGDDGDGRADYVSGRW